MCFSHLQPSFAFHKCRQLHAAAFSSKWIAFWSATSSTCGSWLRSWHSPLVDCCSICPALQPTAAAGLLCTWGVVCLRELACGTPCVVCVRSLREVYMLLWGCRIWTPICSFFCISSLEHSWEGVMVPRWSWRWPSCLFVLCSAQIPSFSGLLPSFINDADCGQPVRISGCFPQSGSVEWAPSMINDSSIYWVRSLALPNQGLGRWPRLTFTT